MGTLLQNRFQKSEKAATVLLQRRLRLPVPFIVFAMR
jgi:hypothetical protein